MVGTDRHAYVSAENASTGWANPSCGATAPGGVGFSKLSIDQQANLHGVGTDGGVYYCGSAWSTSTWHKLAVPVSTFGYTVLSVSTAGPMTSWAVLQKGCSGFCIGPRYLYRFSDYGLQFSATLSGSGVCSGCFVNGQCCPVAHSGSNQVGWAGPHVSSSSGSTSATIDARGESFSGTTTSTLLDIFDCFEQDANCTPQVSQEVSCSVLGPIYSGNPQRFFPNWELATTLVKMRPTQVPPGGTCVTNLGVTECQYDTLPWCTAATSPPDLNPPGVRRVFKAKYPTYWKVFGLCERPGSGFAWTCFPPGGVASAGYLGPDNYPLGDCTKSP